MLNPWKFQLIKVDKRKNEMYCKLIDNIVEITLSTYSVRPSKTLVPDTSIILYYELWL